MMLTFDEIRESVREFRQRLPEVKPPRHDCEVCRLGAGMSAIKAKLTPEEAELIEHCLIAVEAAETDRDVLNCKLHGDWNLYGDEGKALIREGFERAIKAVEDIQCHGELLFKYKAIAAIREAMKEMEEA